MVFDGGESSTTQAPTSASTDSASTSGSTQTSTTDAATTATTEPASPQIPTSAPEIESLPGVIAVVGLNNQTLSLLGPELVSTVVAGSPGEAYAQPTWSPDGRFVAWSRATAEGGGVVIRTVADGVETEYDTPLLPFYMQWRPDSGAIGLLGAGGVGTALVVLDLDTEAVVAYHAATSFYFDWSPDGKSLITHLDASRLEFVDLATGLTTLVDTETGIFQAAEWTPDGESIIYTRPPETLTASAGGALAAQASVTEELVVHHLATGQIDVIAEAAGINQVSLSADAARVAFTAIGAGAETFMQVVDLASGDTELIEAGTIIAFQWSPDSRKIMLLTVEGQTIAYRVWNEGVVTSYINAPPTIMFRDRYLFFWGQYDRSISLWAPDSSAFVFAAPDTEGDTVFLQLLDEQLPIRLTLGSVATFSPAGG